MSAGTADEPELDPIAAVQAWRARGAAGVDPVGWAVVEALARRASAQQGEARVLLLRRVEQLLARHAEAPRPAAPAPAARADTAADGAAVRRAALAGLSELVDRLGRAPSSPALPSPPSSPSPPSRRGAAGATDARTTAAPPVPLRAVTAFKGTWARLRAEQRLRQALAQVPAMAGPLNSSHVVHRALQAMHELSPQYLEAFMSHVDALLSLEQASGAGLLPPRPAARGEGGRRPGAKAVRKA